MDNYVIFLTALLATIASFLLTAGFTWVVTWAFGLGFSWQIAIGVWVCSIAIRVLLQ